MCVVTHSSVCRDAFECEKCLVSFHKTPPSHMKYFNVCHDSFICAFVCETCHVGACDISHSSVRHNSFHMTPPLPPSAQTWLIRIYMRQPSFVWEFLIPSTAGHDSFIRHDTFASDT